MLKTQNLVYRGTLAGLKNHLRTINKNAEAILRTTRPDEFRKRGRLKAKEVDQLISICGHIELLRVNLGLEL